MNRQSVQNLLRRLEELAKITDEPGKITRTFASPAMQRANTIITRWMREAGMTVRVDAIGNVIGHYAGKKSDAKILLLGSHLDTVRNAGKFDGPLGVLLAIASVAELHRQKIRLPFAVEVIGFADEEGVRYQTTYLGSKALAGCFDLKDLRRQDAAGITLAAAIQNFGGNPAQIGLAALNPKKLIGYLEAHIEQGPVLEKRDLAVGIVTAIAGQTRARLEFTGHAGHAGTTPMNLRQDALCAAAEFILAAENLARKTSGLVATVGQIKAEPGASNVIPGEVQLTLDLRHAQDGIRQAMGLKLKQLMAQIAVRRKLKAKFEVVHTANAIDCSEKLSSLLTDSVKRIQRKAIALPSGAGHDAAIMAKITPTAMLFVRCKKGISHHPDESAKAGDVGIALAVLNDFILRLAKAYEAV
ncbi:MAG TPA: allantoate amidohydrolase [Verrucomicrobiae bacterium]|jgi:allantoate deiminase